MKHSCLCETKEIDKNFPLPDGQTLHALEKINLQVYSDEILAIIGPSGCGKSTLLRILAGLLLPTQGQVFYHDKLICGLLPHFSLVFQNFALYPWKTVKQNIEMVLQAMDLVDEEIQARAHDAISLIGLSGFEEVYPREISGGMKQRVGLARALVCQPEILLLDEPFSSLDTFTTEMLRRELLSIWENETKGLKSIILISHDVREVVFLADRIVMMESNPGRIRFVIENTLPRPRDYHSKEFLGLVDRLHDAYAQEEIVPEKLPISPLLPVSPEEILGFLSYLRLDGESSDLYHIGTGSMDHFDRVLMDAEAAELLHFVEIAKRTVTLVDAGNRFLAANFRDRRAIWGEQLLRIPLFIKALEWLQSHPKHVLTWEELSELIRTELPHQDVRQQCKTLIHWGGYGNLFIYHKLSRTLHLKQEMAKRG